MALDSTTFPVDQPTAVWEEESVIVSNRHPGGHRTWSKDLYQFPIKNRIYDIGLIAYSQWFADQYGYPYEYVSKEMGEDGLHFVEFQFFSYQGDVDTMLNFAIEPNANLDLPKENFVQGTYAKPNMPKKRPDYIMPKELKITADEYPWIKYYSKYGRNIRIATLDYQQFKKGASASTGLMGIQRNVFKGLDFITVNTVFNAEALKRKNPSIWIKKKGGRDYGKTIKIANDDFKTYRLPVVFANKAGQLMEPSQTSAWPNVRSKGSSRFNTMKYAGEGRLFKVESFDYVQYSWEEGAWIKTNQVINNKANYFKRVEKLKQEGRLDVAKKVEANWKKYSPN